MRTLSMHTRTRRLRAVFCIGALCVLLSAPVGATPDAPTDAISRFLIERGFVDPSMFDAKPNPEPSIVDQVRDKASEMALNAMNFLGVRYRRGGTSASNGFDCSGFTRHVFESSLGLVLPRRVDDQAVSSGLMPVKRDELKPGDLVFFNTLKRTFSHVGIYVGDGRFIHAPRTGSHVRVEDMRHAYWAKRFTGARRAAAVQHAAVAAPMPSAGMPVGLDWDEPQGP
jgi:hypothetical protein